MRAARRPNNEWRLGKPEFQRGHGLRGQDTGDVVQFRISIPFGRLLTSTVRATRMELPERSSHAAKASAKRYLVNNHPHLAAQRRRRRYRRYRDLYRRAARPRFAVGPELSNLHRRT